jgi:hypothetical protein
VRGAHSKPASAERATAAFQRHGVLPGDRLAIVAAPSLAYVLLFFGGVAAGACMVPMPNRSGARTHMEVAQKPRAVPPGFADMLMSRCQSRQKFRNRFGAISV